VVKVGEDGLFFCNFQDIVALTCRFEAHFRLICNSSSLRL
jgi:hypothetical protein